MKGHKVEFTDKGMRVIEDGRVVKEGPIHEVRDWMDHNENLRRIIGKQEEKREKAPK